MPHVCSCLWRLEKGGSPGVGIYRLIDVVLRTELCGPGEKQQVLLNICSPSPLIFFFFQVLSLMKFNNIIKCLFRKRKTLINDLLVSQENRFAKGHAGSNTQVSLCEKTSQILTVRLTQLLNKTS